MTSSGTARDRFHAVTRDVVNSRGLLWITTPALLLAFLGLWKLYTVVTDVSPLVLPPPEDVLVALIDLSGQRMIWEATYVTLYETVVGFLLAAGVGITLGIVLGKARVLEKILSPFLVATQVVPKVAIVPLLLLSLIHI